MQDNRFVRSRATRYQIAQLIEQGKTLEEAEDATLAGNSNRARYIKSWRQAGVYPYGNVDTPEDYKQPAFAIDLQCNDTYQQAQSNASANTKAQSSAITNKVNWNDPLLTEKLKALIQEALEVQISAMQDAMAQMQDTAIAEAQSSAKQTAIADDMLSFKLRRKASNTSPVSLRIQTELLDRARRELKTMYKGQVSLNRYLEFCLWQLIGRPQELLEPEDF